MSIRKVKISETEFRWEVSVRVDGRSSKRLTRRFEKRSDADAFQAEFKNKQRELKNADYGIRSFEETTFGEEAQYWLERQGLRFSPGHEKRARNILDEILPKFGKFTPNQLHPDRLTRFQSEQLAQGLAPATVNRKTDVVMAILNFSLRHRRIPFHPAAGFRKLPEVREDMKFWERNEAEAFLEFAAAKYPEGSPDRWFYVVYLLALNTGLRAGEIWGLQAQDIAQGGELLHIRRRWDLISWDFKPPKGKKSRYVPCNEELRRELERLVREGKLSSEQTIFRSQAGTPVCQDNFYDRIFKKDVAEAKVKEIRFHDLRHTATTLMIAEGLDIKTVQEICGHKDISTTMKYVHLLGDSIRRAASRFCVKPKNPTLSPAAPVHETGLKLVVSN